MVFPEPEEKGPIPPYDHEDLIANRIRTRTQTHFASMPPLPEGTKRPDDMIFLLGGLPNHGFFPVTELTADIPTSPFAFDKKIKAVSHCESKEDGIDLKEALQYGSTEGLKALRTFTKDFIQRVINPAATAWDTALTTGGADGVGKCFDVLVNPGDSVLFEEFTFNPLLNICREKGGVPVPIKLPKVLAKDTLGQMEYADVLENMLENWEQLYPSKTKPKALYTIPNGHNPLGIAQTLEHKKKILALAEKYNFFIIEDEPYGYLNFQSADEEPNYNLTNDEFIDALHPSFLKLDTTGRVCRVETFSKIFAPGCRLGFVVAHPKLVEYIVSSSNIYTRAPSGITQAVVYSTIQNLGGLEGWIHWISLVRNEYLRRKNAMVKALAESAAGKKGYLIPLDPACGMFVACSVTVPEGRKVKEYMDKFIVQCLLNGVVVVPGGNMAVDPVYSQDRANFVRIAISYADSVELLAKAGERMSDAAVKATEE